MLVLALVPAGPVRAGGALPVSPVVNGGFELTTDEGVQTPADDALATCIGVGHQLWWGRDTAQADLLGRNDAGAAANRTADDPAGTALFTAGVGACVSDSARGYDAAWIVPGQAAQRPAVGWSAPLDGSTTFGDADGDGDREATVAHGGPAAINLWQSFGSPHQAFTADFDALAFRLESGASPAGSVVLALSVTPLTSATTPVPYGFECRLAFPAATLAAHADAQGAVSVDPALGSFSAAAPACDALAARWAGADAAARHDLLGRLRLVELAFGGFNAGAADVVIDDVALTFDRSVAEALATGATPADVPVFVPLPCAAYGTDDNGDSVADHVTVRFCDWTLHEGGSFSRDHRQDVGLLKPIPYAERWTCAVATAGTWPWCESGKPAQQSLPTHATPM